MRFDIASASRTHETCLPARPAKLDLSGLDILVVEDNQFIRKLVTHILTAFGAGSVREASSCAQALDQISLRRPDIIFSDWVMPASGGLDLLRSLRGGRDRNRAHIPFIVLSGHATNEIVSRALGEGADSYIVKPFSAKTIMMHLLKVIEQEDGVCLLD